MNFCAWLVYWTFIMGFEGQFLENFKKWWWNYYFCPGGPIQIYMSYASALINMWKKDRIFAIGRRFGKRGHILHCFHINGVFLEQRSLPNRPWVMFMDLNLTLPNLFIYFNPRALLMNIRLIMIFVSYSTTHCDFVFSLLYGVIYIEGTVEINLMNIRLIMIFISYSTTSCHFVHFVAPRRDLYSRYSWD